MFLGNQAIAVIKVEHDQIFDCFMCKLVVAVMFDSAQTCLDRAIMNFGMGQMGASRLDEFQRTNRRTT